jgi:hypothetical protein
MTYGITAWGGYLPRLRMERSAIAAAHGWMAPSLKGLAKGRRAYCSWDEDVVTMAVEAARNCIGTRERAGIARSPVGIDYGAFSRSAVERSGSHGTAAGPAGAGDGHRRLSPCRTRCALRGSEGWQSGDVDQLRRSGCVPSRRAPRRCTTAPAPLRSCWAKEQRRRRAGRLGLRDFAY